MAASALAAFTGLNLFKPQILGDYALPMSHYCLLLLPGSINGSICPRCLTLFKPANFGLPGHDCRYVCALLLGRAMCAALLLSGGKRWRLCSVGQAVAAAHFDSQLHEHPFCGMLHVLRNWRLS